MGKEYDRNIRESEVKLQVNVGDKDKEKQDRGKEKGKLGQNRVNIGDG